MIALPFALNPRQRPPHDASGYVKVDQCAPDVVRHVVHHVKVMHMCLTIAVDGDAERDGGNAETLADPYTVKIPLPMVNSFQEPFACRQVIQQKSPNFWSDRTNQYLEPSLETHRMHLFPPIATE